MTAGDFGSAVYISVKKRCAEKSTLSIHDVNKLLDELNRLSDKREKPAVLKKLLRSSTAVELKWIVRTILKGMNMHSCASCVCALACAFFLFFNCACVS